MAGPVKPEGSGAGDLPPLRLPVAWFAAGHAALAIAFLLVALRPSAITGFFYHPRMISVVHLVTLGWISTSIFGASYAVAPLALRMPLRTGAADVTASVLVIAGLSGVTAHFWFETYPGVAWSGGVILAAVCLLAARFFVALRRAKSPAAVRWIIGAAWGNLLLAASLGVLLAVDKDSPFLGVQHLGAVYAHVHLAAAGFATLMVMGVALRLIPMFLPAAPPLGPAVWLMFGLFETGVLGLSASLLLGGGPKLLFAVLLVAGIACFFWNLGRALRNRRPAPPALPKPDLAVVQMFVAVGCLAGAAAVGLHILLAEVLPLRWIMVYGVLGLVGFLAQAVLGVVPRLLPMVAWMHAFTGKGDDRPRVSLYAMSSRRLQLLVLVAWTAGVPALAAGLYGDRNAVVSAGAGLLLGGVLVHAANCRRILRHVRRRGAAGVPAGADGSASLEVGGANR